MPFLEQVDEGHAAAEGAFNEDLANMLDPESEQVDADCANEGNEETDKFISFPFDSPQDGPVLSSMFMFTHIINQKQIKY